LSHTPAPTPTPTPPTLTPTPTFPPAVSLFVGDFVLLEKAFNALGQPVDSAILLRHHFCQIHLQARALDALPFFFLQFFFTQSPANGFFFSLGALPKTNVAGNQVSPFRFHFPLATASSALGAVCTFINYHFLFIVLHRFGLGIRRGAGE
jgi:hypothetical protein